MLDPNLTEEIYTIIQRLPCFDYSTEGKVLPENGWSNNVIPLLKQNPNKSIILMNGYDFRVALSGQVDLRDLLLAKVAKLNLNAEPYYSVDEYIKEQVG